MQEGARCRDAGRPLLPYADRSTQRVPHTLAQASVPHERHVPPRGRGDLLGLHLDDIGRRTEEETEVEVPMLRLPLGGLAGMRWASMCTGRRATGVTADSGVPVSSANSRSAAARRLLSSVST
ncbi:hypothetical protein GCM10010297_35080 [Streptomyces malachitofuscus]|nr:hypothetical protein GCM10010297_35080 [Streptomyces malachitofuscus]